MNEEFKKRLQYADDMARKFLENVNTIEDIKDDDDIIDYYLNVFDVSDNNEEDKVFYFHASDYRLKRLLLFIDEIVNEAKKLKRPLTSDEFKAFTDPLVVFLDNAIKENDENKAIYIKRKEELISIFKGELKKRGIDVKDGGCYIATAVYGSYDCPQVWTLRRYRDYNLAKHFWGRILIRFYYSVSPLFLKWFYNKKWYCFFQKPLDKIVENLQEKGYKDTPYSDMNI